MYELQMLIVLFLFVIFSVCLWLKKQPFVCAKQSVKLARPKAPRIASYLQAMIRLEKLGEVRLNSTGRWVWVKSGLEVGNSAQKPSR